MHGTGAHAACTPGTGVAWTFMNEHGRHTVDENQQAGSKKDPLRELQSRVEAAIEDVRPKIRRALDELDQRVDEAVREVKPRAESAMRDVQPKVDQFVADVQPRLDSLLSRLQSRIEDLRKDLDTRASRTGGKADPDAPGAGALPTGLDSPPGGAGPFKGDATTDTGSNPGNPLA
jgi:ElaB/YqjD/DUF883 family membrane-anchored ribosome-binding protein